MSLFKKTVDSILSDVHKKIDQLQVLAEIEKNSARQSRLAAEAAIAAAVASDKEAERAIRIAGKIEDLLV